LDREKRTALAALHGVGDFRQQWIEVTDRATHVRRRLTSSEELRTGPAVDIRGTEEETTRLNAWKEEVSDKVSRIVKEQMS